LEFSELEATAEPPESHGCLKAIMRLLKIRRKNGLKEPFFDRRKCYTKDFVQVKENAVCF